MGTEIERKYLVDDGAEVPPLGAPDLIHQGYLAEDGGVEVRVRTSGSGSVITVKAGSGLERTEVEVGIADDDAAALWPFTEGRRIVKRRYRVDVAGGVAEVDVYEGALAGLRTVEVELASVEDAAAFRPPVWFGRDVTGEPGWSNASLAKHGLPR